MVASNLPYQVRLKLVSNKHEVPKTTPIEMILMRGDSFGGGYADTS